jgi:hypothetical protein
MIKDDIWVSVTEYCKKYGLIRQSVYLDFRLGKIPSDMIRTIEVTEKRKQIKDTGVAYATRRGRIVKKSQ